MNDDKSAKAGLHPRNPHRFRYDFKTLIGSCPSLAPFVAVNVYGNESIDFASSGAVKALNRALLAHFYGVVHWDIPDGYLCPPIPGRADYIHYLADLLGASNGGAVPTGAAVSVLDIGTGANCVYPIIGSKSYGWRFTGSECDGAAAAAAEKNIQADIGLSSLVSIRQQSSPRKIFTGIVGPGELFDASMCNPPFHSSREEASAGSMRKLRNLNPGAEAKSGDGSRPSLNFGGQGGELWCPGGEVSFIAAMIEESAAIALQCLWFTTLVSKKESLDILYRALKKAGAVEVRTIPMAQGQKTSRILAWSYYGEGQRKAWADKRWAASDGLPVSP